MYWVVVLIIILLTISIIKDTHVKEYYNGYCCKEAILRREFDVKLPLWVGLLIILAGLIPMLNIVSFGVFLVYYIIHATWNPNFQNGFTHIYSLKGGNFITKLLLKSKKILNKQI